MSEVGGKGETEVMPRKGEWVVLVWKEEEKEWIYGGRAATERSLAGTVGRLRKEGWKVRVLDEDGREIHSDSV